MVHVPPTPQNMGKLWSTLTCSVAVAQPTSTNIICFLTWQNTSHAKVNLPEHQ